MTSSTRIGGTWPAIAALAVIVVAGGYLRLHNLGSSNLVLEELNHLYVGRALVDSGEPVLPSGYWYTRATSYSRLTEFTGRLVQSPEVAVRLPSALFGTAAVAVLGVGTLAVAGPAAAIGAAALVAVYPEAVIQSRMGRFYMLYFLCGIVALFAGWTILRATPQPQSRSDAIRNSSGSPVQAGSTRIEPYVAAFVAAAALVIATMNQVTALPTVLALWIALAVAGGFDLARGGFTALRNSVPAQLALSVGLAGLIAAAAHPRLALAMGLRASSTPYWARPSIHSPLYYVDILTGFFPLIGLVGLASFGYLLVRQPRFGGYLLAMFAVPMLVMSALPFKADRFALLAAPPLFVAIGAAVAEGARALRSVRSAGKPQRALAMRGAAVLVSAMPLIVALPPSGMFWLGYDRLASADWKSARQILSNYPGSADMLVGATRSLPALFYWDRVDFSVSIGHLERWDDDAPGPRDGGDAVRGGYVANPIGSPDIYTGVPVLPFAKSIVEHFEGSNGTVVIAIDAASRTNGMVDAELLQTLESEAREICSGRCGTLDLYVWTLQPSM